MWSPLSLSLSVSDPSSPVDPSATDKVAFSLIRPVSFTASGPIPVTVIVKVAVALFAV